MDEMININISKFELWTLIASYQSWVRHEQEAGGSSAQLKGISARIDYLEEQARYRNSDIERELGS